MTIAPAFQRLGRIAHLCHHRHSLERSQIFHLLLLLLILVQHTFDLEIELLPADLADENNTNSSNLMFYDCFLTFCSN